MSDPMNDTDLNIGGKDNSEKPRLYIAGPMTGYPEYNFPAFFAAERFYSKAGFDVLNPARVDVETDGFDPRKDPTAKPPLSHAEYMERAKANVASCEYMALLPGWHFSVGVFVELKQAAQSGVRVFLSGHEAIDAKAASYPAKWFVRIHDQWRRVTEPQNRPRSTPPFRVESHAEGLRKVITPQETRIVDPVTGGTKGQKLERHDLIPPDVLAVLAEHYGKCGGNGAELPAKYEDRNWELGYRYSLSIAAAKRHLCKLERGIDVDPESGTLEAVCAAWHLFALAAFQLRGIGTDDRVFVDGVFQPERVRK